MLLVYSCRPSRPPAPALPPGLNCLSASLPALPLRLRLAPAPTLELLSHRGGGRAPPQGAAQPRPRR